MVDFKEMDCEVITHYNQHGEISAHGLYISNPNTNRTLHISYYDEVTLSLITVINDENNEILYNDFSITKALKEFFNEV